MKAAFFICLAFIVFLLQQPSCGRPQMKGSRLVCSPRENNSFWLRNSCWNGYVVVQGNKVFAQHSEISKTSARVKLVKRPCFDPAGQRNQVLTMLYSPHAKRYICFTKCGRLKGLKWRQATGDRQKYLCTFVERLVPDGVAPSTQVTYQSYFRPDWRIGFHSRRSKLKYLADNQRISPPIYMLNRMSSKHLHYPLLAAKSCNFRFSTGQYVSLNKDIGRWTGLMAYSFGNTV